MRLTHPRATVWVLVALWPAAVFAQDIVELPAARAVGEAHRIELIKKRERYDGEKLTASVRTRTVIDVEVIEGGVIRWTYGPSRVEAAAGAVGSEWAGKIAGLTEGLRLDMRTDASGAIASLENTDEVVAHARTAYAALREWIGERGLAKELIGELESALGPSMSPETVEAMALAEPRLLYFPSGGSYRLGVARAYDDFLPNPLGGPSFPSKGSFVLTEVTPDGLARLEWRQVIDPEKAGPILRQTLAAMFERMGRPVPADLPALEVAIADDAKYAYDTLTGWPRSATHTRTISLGDTRTVERRELNVLAER